MSIRVVILDKIACFRCHLLHDHATGKPVGWLVEIAGKSGGVIPFDPIHALAGSDVSPEMVATIVRISAMNGLRDASMIREALTFEAQLARDEIQLH